MAILKGWTRAHKRAAVEEYVGWVPTITGHMSFGSIGEGLEDALIANAEVGPPSVRRVIVLQRRTTRDEGYTGWPMPVFKPWLRTDYLLLGASSQAVRPVLDHLNALVTETKDSVGMLEGEIILVPYHDEPALNLRARALVARLRRLLTLYSDTSPRGVPGDIAALEAQVRAELAAAELAGVKPVKAEFRLFRPGEFRMRLTQVPALLDVEPGSKEAVALAATTAEQLYYFVKDAGHRHFHHDTSTDNMLPLTVTVGNDDEAWRRETLYALARAVLQARRRGRLTDYKAALGLLAYADAFQAHLTRFKRGAGGAFEKTNDIAPYDFAHTRTSVEAKIDERAWITSGWSQVWTVMISTLLAAVALWIAAVQIGDQSCAALPPYSLAAAAHGADSAYVPAPVPVPAAAATPAAPPAKADPPAAAPPKAAPPAGVLAITDLSAAVRKVRPAPTHPAAAPREPHFSFGHFGAPRPGCPTAASPPRWAASALTHIISDPVGLFGVLLLTAFVYFEFARRSLRSVASSGRNLLLSPWEWMSALGSTASRRFRRCWPLAGDRIGQVVSIGASALILATLVAAFVVLV